jgi:hypothetical protein
MVHKTGVTTLQVYTDNFWMAQGKAITTFAGLEQSLSALFCHVGDMQPDVASTIFYRMGNAPTVGKILETLLEKKYHEEYSKFWKSFKEFVKNVIDTRNKIVHWRVVTPASDFTGIKLLPPDYWANVSGKKLTVEEVADFTERCDFASRLCEAFTSYLSQPAPPDGDPLGVAWQTWRDIFRTGVTYPLPIGHPLSIVPQSPQKPLASSNR